MLDITPEQLARLPPDKRRRAEELLQLHVGGEGIRECITRLFPHEPPLRHMEPYYDALEYARRRSIRLCLVYGPGLAKTTTTMRGVGWWLGKFPADLCAYLTYSDAQARDKSSVAKSAYELDGGALNPSKDTEGYWLTPQGGGLVAKGAQSGVMGKRVPGLFVYDDPYKDIMEARSYAINKRVIERFKGSGFTRSQGGSVLVMHQRWDDDDLIGWILKNLKWDCINVASICEASDVATDPLGRSTGEVAWPQQYPYEICSEPCGHDGHLAEIKATIGEHLFAAIYQGKPRPDGHRIFHEPARYDVKDFTWEHKRGVISIDPAATESTTADWSVILPCGMTGFGIESRMWLCDPFHRMQVEVPELVKVARRVQLALRLLVACEAVAGYKAVPQMLRALDAEDVDKNGKKTSLGKLRVIDINPGNRKKGKPGVKIPLHALLTTGDKFVRAQPMAAAWNAGRVLVPKTEWGEALIARFQRWTAAEGQEDDEIDAAGQGWNVLYREAPPPPVGGDSYRTSF